MNKNDEHQIRSVERTKSGGLEAKFQFKNDHGDFEERGNESKGSNMDPHEDLVAVMNRCKEIVARVLNLKDLDKGKTLKEWLERLRINTIHISGEEKTEGVIISATYRNDIGHKMAINTPRVLIQGDKYGVEKKIRSILQDLREEVDAWLYEGKCGPHLFNKEEETTEEPKAEEEVTVAE